MASTPVLISVEEYLHTSYRPDCDYVDGEIEERHVGEYTHNKIQALILFWMMQHATEWNIDPIQEQRINISSSRFRVADVALLRLDTPREEIILTPPLLCIEILSPEERINRAIKVLDDYVAIGVAQSWLIDPLRRAAYVYDNQGLHLVEEDRLELPGTPIYLILSDLFAVLDKK